MNNTIHISEGISNCKDLHLKNKHYELSSLAKSEEHALNLISKIFKHFDQSINNSNFNLLHEYRLLANYLYSPQNQGLLLCGNCGVGKTLTLKYLIPYIFKYEITKQLIVLYQKVYDLKDNYQEIESRRFIILDEIGREDIINDFGTKFQPVVQIINQAADNNRYLFLASNLNIDEMYNRYGESSMDRIKKHCRIIEFNSTSCR